VHQLTTRRPRPHNFAQEFSQHLFGPFHVVKSTFQQVKHANIMRSSEFIFVLY
jgi:hypothetical protein